MWRAFVFATAPVLLALACSGGADLVPPLPTFSPSYWSLEVCRSPIPLGVNILHPSFDSRFEPGLTAEQADEAQTSITIRVDVTISNFRFAAERLESIREPAVAAEFHQAMIDAAQRVGDAVDDARDRIVGAESIAEMEAIDAQLRVLKDENIAELRLQLESLPTGAREALAGRPNCLERLGLEPASAG